MSTEGAQYGVSYLQKGNSPNYKLKIGEEDSAKMLGYNMLQQSGTDAVNAMISGFNYDLQGQQIAANRSIGEHYYDTMKDMDNNRSKVAMAQVDVQETALFVQKDMHAAQIQSEEKRARLEGSVRARIETIKENGKNERARILSTMDAFRSRDEWSMGNPLMFS